MAGIVCVYKLRFYLKCEGDFFQGTVDIMIWISSSFYKNIEKRMENREWWQTSYEKLILSMAI